MRLCVESGEESIAYHRRMCAIFTRGISVTSNRWLSSRRNYEYSIWFNFFCGYKHYQMDANIDAKQYWLLKVEPSDYPWSRMESDGTTTWNGIHNHQAQKYLRTMKCGDLALYYHTEKEKAIVGIVEVAKEFYVKDDDPKFGMVDVGCVRALERPITLAEIKCNDQLSDMTILRQPRLSVSSITPDQWARIIAMSEEKKK